MSVISHILPFIGLWILGATSASLAQDTSMSFFITSVGTGTGANLGGLAGADQHCLKLAEAAGVGSKTWRAYLSTQAQNGATATNARDRVGKGPWRNARGVVIAKDIDELHGNNHLTKETALSEKGEIIKGRGDQPNMHDILTGTQPDGTAFPAGEDSTCGNWTKSATEGAAMVGHHDRIGRTDAPPAKSWNSSHPTRGGCSQDALKGTGGAGLFYCFAAD
jgi:hypothetical protein